MFTVSVLYKLPMNIIHLTLLNNHLPKPGNSIPKNKYQKQQNTHMSEILKINILFGTFLRQKFYL